MTTQDISGLYADPFTFHLLDLRDHFNKLPPTPQAFYVVTSYTDKTPPHLMVNVTLSFYCYLKCVLAGMQALQVKGGVSASTVATQKKRLIAIHKRVEEGLGGLDVMKAAWLEWKPKNYTLPEVSACPAWVKREMVFDPLLGYRPEGIEGEPIAKGKEEGVEEVSIPPHSGAETISGSAALSLIKLTAELGLPLPVSAGMPEPIPLGINVTPDDGKKYLAPMVEASKVVAHIDSQGVAFPLMQLPPPKIFEAGAGVVMRLDVSTQPAPKLFTEGDLLKAVVRASVSAGSRGSHSLDIEAFKARQELEIKAAQQQQIDDRNLERLTTSMLQQASASQPTTKADEPRPLGDSIKPLSPAEKVFVEKAQAWLDEKTAAPQGRDLENSMPAPEALLNKFTDEPQVIGDGFKPVPSLSLDLAPPMVPIPKAKQNRKRVVEEVKATVDTLKPTEVNTPQAITETRRAEVLKVLDSLDPDNNLPGDPLDKAERLITMQHYWQLVARDYSPHCLPWLRLEKVAAYVEIKNAENMLEVQVLRGTPRSVAKAGAHYLATCRAAFKVWADAHSLEVCTKCGLEGTGITKPHPLDLAQRLCPWCLACAHH